MTSKSSGKLLFQKGSDAQPSAERQPCFVFALVIVGFGYKETVKERNSKLRRSSFGNPDFMLGGKID